MPKSAATIVPGGSDIAGFGGISLVDRLMVMDEIAKYAWAWDGGDIEDYLNRYLEDGALEHPTPDGKAGRYEGREAIRTAIAANMAGRPTNGYALQHNFSSLVLTPDGEDIQARAYCTVFRHEFHRIYWPHGPSFRMGTWHALYARRKDGWGIKLLSVRMWTDTAFNSGTAIQNRPPGSPGVGTPFG
jgi:ketosteroid isomerase-like protein